MTRFILLLFTTCLFISCGPGKDYPAAVKANFIKSCAAKANGNTVLCECMFEKIKERYTYKEFVELENNLNKGIQSKPFMNYVDSATRRCIIENEGKK